MNTEGTACPFKKGDRVDIDKGTLLYERYWGHRQPEAKYTTRKSTATITDIKLEKQWPEYLTTEQLAEFKNKEKACREKWEKIAGPRPESPYFDPVTRQRITPSKDEYDAYEKASNEWYARWEGHSKEHNMLNWEYEKLAISQASIENFVIQWSGGETYANMVQPTAKAAKPNKITMPNKRQLMVSGSKWKVTQDVTIQYDIRNPAFDVVLDAWEKANPRPPQLQYWQKSSSGSHTVQISYTPAEEKAWRDADEAWRKSWLAAKKAQDAITPEIIKADYVEFKAGDILEVDGKFLTYWRSTRLPIVGSFSNIVVLKRASDNSSHGVEYKQISDFIEADSIPMVKVFVLRHKTSGQYFKSYDWEESRGTGEFTQATADTFMKGKKWDNLGKAKTSILMMSGYYEGLPGADESLPEWGGGQSMSREQLEEYDLVEFNKLDRQEIGLAEGFHEWFKRSWELRELTVRYGSSVRTTYKALEKANLLDSQKGMIVFTVTNEEALDKVGYWGDKTALTDEDKAEIELATASMKKGTFKKAIDAKSMAVSFPNKAAAMIFKLSYNGNLKVSVIDLEDMKEAVEG